jgi:hypothetical protein
MPSIFWEKNTSAPSVFLPAALLREARRQRGLRQSMCRPSASWTRTAMSFGD